MARNEERPPDGGGEHTHEGMTRRRLLSSAGAGMAAMSLPRVAAAAELAPKRSVFEEYHALGLAELVHKKKVSPHEPLSARRIPVHA